MVAFRPIQQASHDLAVLADLGLGRLRVLGTPRRQVGLAGFGLDVVEYVQP